MGCKDFSARRLEAEFVALAAEGEAWPNFAASTSEGSLNNLRVVMKPRGAFGCSQGSSNLSVLSTVLIDRLHHLENDEAV